MSLISALPNGLRLVLFSKSQLALFEEIRPVKGSVDKHGKVRAPHFARRVVSAKKPGKTESIQLDLFSSQARQAPKPGKKTLADVAREFGQFSLFGDAGEATEAARVEAPAPKVDTLRDRTLEALRAFVAGKGGKEKLGETLLAVPDDKLQSLIAKFAENGLSADDVRGELGITAARAAADSLDAERAERAAKWKQARQDAAARVAAAKSREYRVGDAIDGLEFNMMPPGSVVELWHEGKPEGRRFMRGNHEVFMAKRRGEGWQKNPATPSGKAWMLDEKTAYRVLHVGAADWIHPEQKAFAEKMLELSLKRNPNSVLARLNGTGGLVIVNRDNPRQAIWIGEKPQEWGAGFSKTDEAALQAGAYSPVDLSGANTDVPSFHALNEATDKMAAGSIDAALLEGLPEGSSIIRGKGLIKNRFAVKLENGDVPASFEETPEKAVEEAKASLLRRAKFREESEQRAALLGAIADRLKAGGEVSDADLATLDLKAGSSDLKWFIPAAASLFGVPSRAIRPFIADQIRTGHTDMGAKREFVSPKVALAAVAAGVAAKDKPAEAADSPATQVGEHGHEYRPMGAPKVLYRAVSPEEFEAIKESGSVSGGLNTFNGFDPRREVFFGPEMSPKLIGQGEDVSRRAEYAVQSSDLNKRYQEVGQKIKALYLSRKELVEKLIADRTIRSAADAKFQPKIKAMDKKIRALDDERGKLESDGRAQIKEAIAAKRAADQARGYSSVVLETKPVSGGRVYSGKHSGMGEEDEIGFESGAVKAGDIAKVHFIRNGEVVRTEAFGVAEEGPHEGERNADGLVFRDGRWHRDDEGQAPAAGVSGYATPAKLDLPTVELDGDTWYVLNTGHRREDGKVLAHLASATRGNHAKNGVHPLQMETYVDMPMPGAKSGLEMPEFAEGKTTVGVKDYYEKVAGQIISLADAGDVAGLEAMKVKGMTPNAKGKVSNTWAGKTANSKLVLALHAKALAAASGAQVQGEAVLSTKPVAEAAPGGDDANLASTKPAKVIDTKSPISDSDPDAIERLQAKLEKLQKVQDQMKRANKMIRAGDDDGLRAAGFSDAQIAQLKTKDFAGRIGFPDYAIKNNGAQINLLKKRIAGLVENAPKQPAAPVALAEAEPVAAAVLPGLDYSGEFDSSAMPEFGVRPGVSKQSRRDLNQRVADLVRSGRDDFSEEEKALLRQYSGWGGCGQSLNEFYTPVTVAGAIWKAMTRMGLKPGAKVLEPSCGAGVFLHTAPAGVVVTGVEMDATSSQVAAALHGGRHEVVNSGFERFATTDDRQFDAVIGNPPFGPRGEMVAWDKQDISRAEQYFVDASLDKCAGGGIVALVLPTGIMDNQNARWLRERILRKGEFLGAIRMPNTAFEASHTEVTTDVLFVRKRDNDAAQALMTVDKSVLKTLGLWDEDFLAGSYFTDGRGKENICGVLEDGWRAKAGIGNDITVNGGMSGVPEAIAGFEPEVGKPVSFSDVLDKLDADGKAKATNAAKVRPYQARLGDVKEVDGVAYVLQGNPPRWHRIDEVVDSAKVGRAAELAKLIDTLAKWREGGADGDIQSTTFKELPDAIRAFMAEHGNPNKDADLLLAAKADRTLYRLLGAVKPDGSLSDLVQGKVAERIVGSFETAAESLAAEGGEFTAADVADRWRKGDESEVVEHLHASDAYCLNPETGRWTTADNYLAGELWPKLDSVRSALAGELSDLDRAKLEGQAIALEKKIDPRILNDVEIRLNDAWIPLNVVEAWFKAKQDAEGVDNQYVRDLKPVEITFEKGLYRVTGGNSYQMEKFEKYLNRSGLRRDDKPMIDGWNEEFKSWLCGSEYRESCEELYNRKFRGFVEKTFSNAPFEIPGMVTDGLKDYQYGGLRWALNAGKGIVAADVGLGKTARGLMLARMMKVSGQSKRPVIVVPKSVLANWVAEANKWFPGASVAVIGETYVKNDDGSLKGKVDNAAERNRKLHDLLQNEYDFILISRDAFNDIDLSPTEKGDMVDRDFWTQRGDSLGNKGDKQLNDIRTRHKQAAAGMDFRKRSDALWFDELGIDGLIVDEAHAYKNLWAAKARFGDSPKYLGGSAQSKRARDMFYKTQWLRARTDGKNVYGLTATPTKNSPLEIYSMLSHVAPEAFEQIGIRNSEEFLDRFCQFATEYYIDPTSQKYVSGEVVSGFKNLDELRGIMDRYIDRTTADMVGLKLPAKDERNVLVSMSASQQAEYDRLRQMAEEASKQDAADGEAHIFSIMDKMAKAATDLELLDPVKYKGAKSPKLEEAADNILKGVADGGQVVFSDYLATHQKIADLLVKRGIPRDQIAIINAKEAEDSADRQNIADAFNAGKVKVVIGNTATMGEGINLQHGTTDIHHIDLPWEPASVQQRNGRGVRQGNKSESVRIHTYMVKGTFDGVRWDAVAAKKDWQDLLWNGGDTVENLAKQKFSNDEMRILLSADPDEARQQYQSDKESAAARFRAEKRAEAIGQFKKFRDVQASFSALKDKNTKTANSLRMRLDSWKNALRLNPFFKDKELLNGDAAAVISPASGEAFYAGKSFELGEGAGAKAGRYVVVGADGDSVIVRKYGEPAGKYGTRMSVEHLADVVPGVHSEAEEAAYVQRKMEEAVKAGQSAIRNPKEAAHLPEETTRKLYDQLQAQMKEAFVSYKDGWAYGANVPLVHPETGEAKAIRSYDARKHLEDGYHLMLPSLPEHREKAMNAWVEQERTKSWGQSSSQKRRGGRTEWQNSVYYAGRKYDSDKSNPWGAAVKELFGDDFLKEARAKFEESQLERVKAAPNTVEAVKALAPLLAPVNHQYGSVSPAWGKQHIAVLYAKAKANGDLGRPVSEVATASSYGSDGEVPAWVLAVNSGNSLGSVLYERAKAYPDLAAVMALDRDMDPLGKMAALEALHTKKQTDPRNWSNGYTREHHPDVLAAMRHLVDKHPDIGDKLVREVLPLPSGGLTDAVFGGEAQGMTMREALNREVKNGN